MYDAFVDVVYQHGLVDPERLQQARRENEMSGGSFDVISYLFQEQLLSESILLDITEEFCAHSLLQGGHALEKGALEFLKFLGEMRQPFGIMSYGNPRWQNLKINACGLADVSRMIVTDKYKGTIITSWFQPEIAAFSVPGDLHGNGELVAREVVLIDDKAAAFDDLPERAHGYWLQLASPLLSSQMGDVPANVAIVHSYNEIIGIEASREAGHL